jgi:hypothetical protein
MKKSLSSTVLSSKKCAIKDCDKKLKQRIINEKPKIKICYTCFRAMRLKCGLGNRAMKKFLNCA